VILLILILSLIVNKSNIYIIASGKIRIYSKWKLIISFIFIYHSYIGCICSIWCSQRS